MKKLFTIFLLISVLSVFPQEQKVYFDDALTQHLKKYNIQCEIAIESNNVEYVDVLFDSLQKTFLKGTLVSKLQLKKVSGGYIDTDEITTPIILISKKTCFITLREEITAINEMANQYKDKVAFIVLYWDRKPLVKKATKGFNKNVQIVYVNERFNKLDKTLSSIKNSFGVPASFYITENKQLSNIDRKFFLKNLKQSTKKEFYENTYKDISELLLQSENSKKETDLPVINN